MVTHYRLSFLFIAVEPYTEHSHEQVKEPPRAGPPGGFSESRGLHLSPNPTCPLLAAEYPPNSIFHVFVSQAINNGVEEGGEDNKGDSNRCVPEHRVGGWESQIHDSHTAEKQQEHGDVGGTGGKSFVSALSWGHPENHHDDPDVGEGDDQEGGQDFHRMDGIHNDHQGCIRAGQPQHRREVTEDLLDLVGTTERQGGDPRDLREDEEEATEAGSGCQLDTEFGRHDGWVTEGTADSYVPVDGHCCQDAAFCDTKRVEEVHLHEAASQRDGLLLTDQAGEHFGDGGRGVPDLQEREDADEEIHGGVQGRVQLDDHEYHQVPSHDKSIDEKQGDKE